MREVFDDDEDELPPLKQKLDTEVTLGPMAVAGLIIALLLLCCLCFGLGYSMGSRGSKSALTAAPSASAPVSGAASSASKPGAVSLKTTAAPSGNSGASTAAVQPSDSKAVQPGALMVQIAVVSHHEDADVLVAALHKRGYAVSLSQDEADGQFHVRVGPFSSLAEASAMRQKLLNDGYNAVVQP